MIYPKAYLAEIKKCPTVAETLLLEEMNRIQEQNRKLRSLLSRAREAINEEAYPDLDEEIRAAIEAGQ
jgi:queuine/archaeosine tRNA-ribosyltransferase